MASVTCTIVPLDFPCRCRNSCSPACTPTALHTVKDVVVILLLLAYEGPSKKARKSGFFLYLPQMMIQLQPPLALQQRAT